MMIHLYTESSIGHVFTVQNAKKEDIRAFFNILGGQIIIDEKGGYTSSKKRTCGNPYVIRMSLWLHFPSVSIGNSRATLKLNLLLQFRSLVQGLHIISVSARASSVSKQQNQFIS